MNQVKFQCRAVKEKGLVPMDTRCCSTCHEGLDDIPFIVVWGQKTSVCCAVASAYNASREKERSGRVL